ncbi:hypothetical protein BACCIP111895_02020 [Neobacillus rhizosphaerae]|uniref:Group-specific protein n=1 Tax=Neobacillus rhizosphaerae TaxID=2880965 RepID=A0ABM9ERS1_9BACI|nr:hypothetical protein [Neobacillus rhizosphaerae]CAH2714844.1 hypothetical protein BACCIP111895_02020 [Neobacillus rhizosphaerae]
MANIFAIIVFFLLLQWDKGKKRKMKDLVINVIILSVLLFLSNLIGDYLKNNWHVSIPFIKQVPENVKLWFGGTLFFGICCAFSVKGWINQNQQKKASITGEK